MLSLNIIVQSQDDIDRIFKEKVDIWNLELQEKNSGHPDMHWISLRGLRGEDRFAEDGLHYTGAAQKQFAKYLKRALFSIASMARDVPGIDF